LKKLEAYLKEILEDEIKYETDKFQGMFLEDVFGPELLGKMNLNGRRVRGMQILVGYYIAVNGFQKGLSEKAVRECVDKALPLAVGIEFIQTAMLIQDDVIDGAILRRGQNAIHMEFLQNEKSPCKNNSMKANGAAHALAVTCFSYGLNLILKEGAYDSKIREEVYQMLYETISGEALDVLLPLDDRVENWKEDIKSELALSIAEKKTAVYSFAFPLSIGFLLDGKNEEADIMKEIGFKLGIVYQLENDLRELNAMETGNGKPYDLIRYRITYANALAMSDDDDLRERIWIVNKSDEEIKEIVMKYPVDKIKLEVQRKKEAYIKEAKELFVKKIEWDDAEKEAFWTWIERILGGENSKKGELADISFDISHFSEYNNQEHILKK
jgi:geranylgeranyl pyrophosphate synthase